MLSGIGFYYAFGVCFINVKPAIIINRHHYFVKKIRQISAALNIGVNINIIFQSFFQLVLMNPFE